jgi:hypothetical protein
MNYVITYEVVTAVLTDSQVFWDVNSHTAQLHRKTDAVLNVLDITESHRFHALSSPPAYEYKQGALLLSVHVKIQTHTHTHTQL